MKRLLIAALLLTNATVSHADHRWIAPALVGGLIGYVAGTNQNVYTFQPQPVYTPPPVIYYETMPEPQPVYGYEWVFDETCYCNRQILVRLN